MKLRDVRTHSGTHSAGFASFLGRDKANPHSFHEGERLGFLEVVNITCNAVSSRWFLSFPEHYIWTEVFNVFLTKQ